MYWQITARPKHIYLSKHEALHIMVNHYKVMTSTVFYDIFIKNNLTKGICNAAYGFHNSLFMFLFIH